MTEENINYFIMADGDRCMGCKNCEIACITAHTDISRLAAASPVKPLKPRITVSANSSGIDLAVCRQCETAPCAQACRVGAIVQEEGCVRIKEENCIGCKLCIKVCPFGCISIQENLPVEGESTRTRRGKAIKCDLCSSLKQDETGHRCACVRACPTKALQLTNSKEQREKYPAALTRKPA